MDIFIVNYNTQKLTDALISSILMHVQCPVIHIFDNSDKQPYVNAHGYELDIIDNTKGQVIDFDLELAKYPRKDMIAMKLNGLGSAKHCMTVEKWMYTFKKPFVLLDSDVLIKKDFSELCRDDILFAGEIGQNIGAKARVLPFICYINTPKCIDNGIHYFSPKRMHGINDGSVGNLYDTGASFLEDSRKLPYNVIRWNSYVEHLKGGSWNDPKTSHKLSEDEWLEKYKYLWKKDTEQDKLVKKKVIYTCITGNYDILREPRFINQDFDYVCFTDNSGLASNTWQIRTMPKETEEIPSNKKQRFVKINPHIVLPEYELSVWVDGNVETIGDLNELISDEVIIIPQHPIRNCIYDEMKACGKLGKDKNEIMQPQIDRYKREGFPARYGMVQSNIIIRRHNDEGCKRVMNLWWEELSKGSHRDQLSFNYCLWRNQDVKVKLLNKFIYKSKWFAMHPHKRFIATASSNKTIQTLSRPVGSRNWKLRTPTESKVDKQPKIVKRRINFWT